MNGMPFFYMGGYIIGSFLFGKLCYWWGYDPYMTAIVVLGISATAAVGLWKKG